MLTPQSKFLVTALSGNPAIKYLLVSFWAFFLHFDSSTLTYSSISFCNLDNAIYKFLFSFVVVSLPQSIHLAPINSSLVNTRPQSHWSPLDSLLHSGQINLTSLSATYFLHMSQ